jgi:hypothetical protein
MRPLRLLPSFVVLALLVVPLLASASGPRIVLVESFTNTGCVNCPAANAATHTFVEDFGSPVILNLQYHLGSPAVSDPFYQANITDNEGRQTYYGITAAPDLITDGVNTPAPGSYDALKSAVGAAHSMPSPFTLTVGTTVNGNDIDVDVSVTATEDVPATGLVLQIALVEPYVLLNPPGPNGEADHYCTMRDMLPSFSGQPLTITNGQTLMFQESATLDPTWQDIYAIAWVQNDNDQSVMQVASSLPAPDYSMAFRTPETSAVVPMGLHTFHTSLENLGQQSDTYEFSVDWNVPAGWGGGVCEGGVCHQIGENNFNIRMDPGATEEVTVDIEPFGSFGEGSCTVTITSQATGAFWQQIFKVITYGVPILCVDDDEGEAYEAYYHAALDATGYLYGTWDLMANGKADAALLNHFPIVIWNAGDILPSLDANDRDALGAYLDDGGKLFISGQDIGFDLYDPSGPGYGPGTQTWYSTYFGATYVRDDTNLLSIVGVGGDPIGDGLAFDIFGGTGANNQSFPSEIAPFGGGVACLDYDTDGHAGVRYDSGTFQTVYFAFGFEGIAQAADRETVMQKVLDWFGADLVDAPGERATTPYLVSLPTANPNPFNPLTTIQFSVGGNQTTPVEVAIYDLRGKLVRNLWRGPVQPGPQAFVWDGRADGGRAAASGIYLARVSVAGQQQTIKMTLAK